MFTQAGIALENPAVFGELKAAIDAAFVPGQVEKFLRGMERQKVPIREFERALQKRLLPRQDAAQLYEALSVSDRSQIREHYLTKLEQVEDAVRTKFHKLFSYY